MRICVRVVTLGAVVGLLGLAGGPALAEGPVGRDPSSNFPLKMNSLPHACWSAPRGATCVAAGVRYLNQARAHLGQPAYALPRRFATLPPTRQVFILTNLDRIRYRLSPIPGLTMSLDRDAAAGVRRQTDPAPSTSDWEGYTSNWAAGYPNIVLAYGSWMYDDGPGSGNLDCSAHHTSGCWGHRHDILWKFARLGAVAMGAAAGKGPGGVPGYAMLLEQRRPGRHPTYTYRWRQALAAGAGK